MKVKKLIEEDQEVVMRQFAIDWGLDVPEVRAWFRANRLAPIRPDPEYEYPGEGRKKEKISIP